MAAVQNPPQQVQAPAKPAAPQTTATNAPAPQAVATPTAQPAQKQKGSGKTILVVEDDPILSRMYSEKLAFEGFQVVNAYNGEDALTVCNEKQVDGILLDIMLPKLSGTDFLAQLRQKPSGKNTVVIVLTNLDQADEKKKATELGAKEYLVKANQTPESVVQNMRKYL